MGGPKLAIETIERNFGIDIDRYAVVDFQSFVSVIDRPGGVTMELSDSEVNFINQWADPSDNNTPLNGAAPTGFRAARRWLTPAIAAAQARL